MFHCTKVKRRGLYVQIIEAISVKETECFIDDVKGVFRPERGGVHQIFTLKQISKKA